MCTKTMLLLLQENLTYCQHHDEMIQSDRCLPALVLGVHYTDCMCRWLVEERRATQLKHYSCDLIVSIRQYMYAQIHTTLEIEMAFVIFIIQETKNIIAEN